jgi:hypothetical protein
MSLKWMPAIERVPPRSRASSATGTRSPAGAKRIAESRGSGGCSSAPLAEAQPSSSARRRASSERVSTCTVAPWWRATWAARWAEPPQRPVADDAGAEQGRSLLVGEDLGQPIGEALVHHGVLGVATVCVPAGETGGLAKVLVASLAEAAPTAGEAQPGYAHPFAFGEALGPPSASLHDSYDLVARDCARPVGGKVALGEVEVCAADPADRDPHLHLPRARLGLGHFAELERSTVYRPRGHDLPGAHSSSVVQRIG